MEKQAHQRGYQMRWDNSAWALLQYIDFVREEKEIVTGRGIKFIREKPSIFQKKRQSPVSDIRSITNHNPASTKIPLQTPQPRS
jgi:hypothetical protein